MRLCAPIQSDRQNNLALARRPWPVLWVCSLLLSCTNAFADSTAIRISTDIAPVHSLVTQVVGDQLDVDLIIPPNQSPHDFALKPSQRRALNKADLIVIVSPNFTPSLGRHLRALNNQSTVLNLADALLTTEHQSGDSGKAKQTDAHGEHDDHAKQQHLLHDEHTWLNPVNAIAWLEYIAAAVASIDEANREAYERNANNAIADLNRMHQLLLDQLSGVRSVQYIVYHDAYRHFATAFKLSDPHAIALSDARSPGAAKLKRIRALGQQSKCAFSEQQHDDAIVNTVTAGLKLKRGTLDPLGSDLTLGPKLYTQLMHSLANSFTNCLSG